MGQFGKSVWLRLDARRLLIALAVVAPLLLADMIVVLDRSREAHTAAAKEYLETVARTAGAGVEEFVDSGVSYARILASRSDVVEAAAKVSGGPPPDEEALMGIDRNWQTPVAEAEVRGIVANPVAAGLRTFIENAPGAVRALVTDRYGRTIAASHKPELYYHGDQAWWAQTIGDGSQGRAQVGGVVFDPVSRESVVPAAAPIVAADRARVVGTVRIFFRAAGVTPYLEEALPGTTGESLLTSSDGRLIASGRGGRSPDDEVAEMASVRALSTSAASGAVRTTGRGREELVGYMDLGLRQAYPDLDWTVLVIQSWEDVNAPIAPVVWRALATAGVALLALAALAVFFNTHRKHDLDPLDEIEKT